MELEPSTLENPGNLSIEEKRQFIRQIVDTRIAQLLGGLTPEGVEAIQEEIDGLANEQVEQRYSQIKV